MYTYEYVIGAGGSGGVIIYIFFNIHTYAYCDSLAMWATDIVVSQITIACYRTV